MLFHAIFHPLQCFGRVAFDALGSVLGICACVHAFQLSLFHLMATDMSVAEVHSHWYKSILHRACHIVHVVTCLDFTLRMLGC